MTCRRCNSRKIYLFTNTIMYIYAIQYLLMYFTWEIVNKCNAQSADFCSNKHTLYEQEHHLLSNILVNTDGTSTRTTFNSCLSSVDQSQSHLKGDKLLSGSAIGQASKVQAKRLFMQRAWEHIGLLRACYCQIPHTLCLTYRYLWLASKERTNGPTSTFYTHWGYYAIIAGGRRWVFHAGIQIAVSSYIRIIVLFFLLLTYFYMHRLSWAVRFAWQFNVRVWHFLTHTHSSIRSSTIIYSIYWINWFWLHCNILAWGVKLGLDATLAL